MKPPQFEYFAPETLEEALVLRAEHAADSAVLAGGQSLMPLLNLRLVEPAVVIDLRRVYSLTGIRASHDGVTIGAMARQRAAEQSPIVAQRCPLLVRALEHVGHPAIRNRGTIGGSLAHALAHAEIPAVAVALDARIVVRSIRGGRTIDARDFFLGPTTTALAADELIVEVELPDIADGRPAFVELSRRHRDIALAAVAVLLRLDGDRKIADARIAFAGVAATPIRPSDAEAMLRGASPSEALFVEASTVAVASLDPVDDIHASGAYRRRVAGVLLRRALAEVTT